jgi:O-antigen biosynthesis protein
MKFSIITPTHKKTPYLKELYESILAQDYENWEWILWLNGKMTKEDVKWITDPRVKKIKDKSNNDKVGYHKHKAFFIGTGDILVEADHDDILTPNCLSILKKEFEENPEVGFVASDNAKLQENGDFIPYNAAYGWQHRQLDVDGKKLWVPHTFEPTSHSMCFIWFTPDHVRAWRKDIYRMVGGHNSDLSILDDQELMIRTYLVTKFKQLHEVLYVYRIDGSNTWLERGESIQTGTVQLAYEWSQRLAERDADLNGKLKVDLGGGLNSRPGYVTIDQEGGDITADLNDGIPLEDNSVGVMNASHIIEHLRDPLKTMREIHRVLHHGGWAFIEVPSTDGRGAWQDPTHVSYWNENSFWYYTKKEQADFIRNKDIRFMTNRLQTHYPSQWWKDHHIPVVTANLIALKGGDRFPGLIEI